MQEKPYFCPDCRSNRFKFKVEFNTYQSFTKDPITGAIGDLQDPVQKETAEPTIVCGVCGFAGNEMRFIKQAEREPRTGNSPVVTFT